MFPITIPEQIQALSFAVVIAFVVALIVGPIVIPALLKLKVRQTEREDGPQSHLKKSGTPSMGGLIILVGLLVPCAILMRGDIDFLSFSVLVTLGFGLVGFLDDYIKARKHRSLGLKAYQKIIAQFGLALIFAWYAYQHPLIGSSIFVPIANIEWDLGLWYIPITMFVIIGTVNSVNLCDGVDGLVSGVTMIVAAAFGIICMAMLNLPDIEPALAMNIRNLMVFTGGVAGACLGFLRFNARPAKVFMGDTGSFVLGGAVVAMAIATRTMLLLPLMGICYVISSVSDIIQVGSYKLRKKRVFRMAPFHHHLELGGMSETQIGVLYMSITGVCCLAAIMLLQ